MLNANVGCQWAMSAAGPHDGRKRKAWTTMPSRHSGFTHTVAAFSAAAASGPTIGRLVGVFHGQGGGSLGPGGTMATFGLLSDTTGSIPVILPLSVPDVGGRQGDVEVEVELEAYGPLASPPDLDTRDIQDAALSGDMATASARAGDLGHALHDAASRMPVIRRMVPLR